MRDTVKVVLGNHDITLLILNESNFLQLIKYDKSFNEILNAYDKNKLVSWLRKQPLFHHDSYLNFSMVHAGILPSWSLEISKKLSDEIRLYFAKEKQYHFLLRLFDVASVMDSTSSSTTACSSAILSLSRSVSPASWHRSHTRSRRSSWRSSRHMGLHVARTSARGISTDKKAT